MVNEGVKPVFQ